MVTEPGPCYWALGRAYWRQPQKLLGKLVLWTVMCELWPARARLPRATPLFFLFFFFSRPSEAPRRIRSRSC